MNGERLGLILLLSTVTVLSGCTLPRAQLAVVCYDEEGQPASGFSGGVITDIPTSGAETAYAGRIAMWLYGAEEGEERPWEGNLVIAGDAGSRSERRFVVARYQEDNGELEDLHFEGGGILTTDFPGASSASALALDLIRGRSTGIVVAGKALVGDRHRFALARYSWSGRLVSDFGGDGRVLTSFPGADDAVARAVAFVRVDDDDYRILAGGDAGSMGNRHFALARYGLDGSLDSGFDGDGLVITDFPETSTESISDLAVVEVEGALHIVVAGGAYVDDRYRIALGRYRWDGSADPDFVGGRILIDVPGSTSSYANALEIDNEGRLVVGGYAQLDSGEDQFVVARFLSDGTPDPDFGSGGFVLTGFPGADGARVHGMDLDPDGHIIVAGRAFIGGWRFALARYLADGSLDPGFDGDGRVLTDLPTDNEVAHDVAYDSRPLPDRVACAVGEAGD